MLNHVSVPIMSKIFYCQCVVIVLFYGRCDTNSNCLKGNAKKVKNCTIFSPPICEGCADGNLFDNEIGQRGRCMECKPPCGFLEVETRNCTTEHDRECTTQWTVKEISKPSKLKT